MSAVTRYESGEIDEDEMGSLVKFTDYIALENRFLHVMKAVEELKKERDELKAKLEAMRSFVAHAANRIEHARDILR